MEDKAGGSGKANAEHALAILQLREDNTSHMKEIMLLSNTIAELTKQIKELKDLKNKGKEDKENKNPSSPRKHKKFTPFKWSNDLKFNPTWSLPRKRAYNKILRENDPKC